MPLKEHDDNATWIEEQNRQVKVNEQDYIMITENELKQIITRTQLEMSWCRLHI